MKISRLKLPPRGRFQHYLIAGDWHTDELCEPTFNIMLDYARDLKVNKKKPHLIINGDFLDVWHLRLGEEQYKRHLAMGVDGIEEFFLPESEHEFQWGNNILDKLEKYFDKIYYIFGNHDLRYELYRRNKLKDGAYAHNFDVSIQLDLKKRGIQTVEYNHWLDLGQSIAITHGFAHGTSAWKKHYEAAGNRTTIFSHIHNHEIRAFQARGKTRKSISLPCISTLNPDWLKGKPNNWTTGFGHIILKSNGHFNCNVYETWDNELFVGGKHYAYNAG